MFTQFYAKKKKISIKDAVGFYQLKVKKKYLICEITYLKYNYYHAH